MVPPLAKALPALSSADGSIPQPSGRGMHALANQSSHKPYSYIRHCGDLPVQLSFELVQQMLAFFEGGDESGEHGMRAVRARGKFGVILARQKERMINPFNNFY